MSMTRITRAATGALLSLSVSACAGTGGVGDILGAVLGGGAGGQQVAGVVQGVDTRSQQLALQQSNGQTVQLQYDNNTQVVFQNQRYPVTALEYGDEVLARVRSTNNNTYYTDSITVTRSVSSGGAGGSANVQSFQGTVRQVDRNAALFTMATGNAILTVTLPYQLSQTDANRFANLRVGESVRFYGVYVSNTRVELRQFY